MPTGFAPIIPKVPPRLLILGSLPSDASVSAGRYYAHPQNAFWYILSHVFGFYQDAQTQPDVYTFYVQHIKQLPIAIWDVIAHAERQGSLDAAISAHSIVPNDIAGLITQYPSITCICLNGASAAKFFKKYIAASLPSSIEVMVLPSTSPAHARLSRAQKLAQWQVIAEKLIP